MDKYVIKEPSGKVTEVHDDFWENNHFENKPHVSLKFKDIDLAWEKFREVNQEQSDISDYGIDFNHDIYELDNGRISLFGRLEKI